MRGRLFKHYVLLLSAVLFAMLLFFIERGKRDPITFIAQSTGYISLVMLAMIFTIGPVNLLLKNKNPVSAYFRRDAGIAGGSLALIHSFAGLFVHLRGRMWLYFLDERHHIRLDHFGLANYTGMIAALIIIVLIITSNDYFFKKLQVTKWKNIQRMSYLMILLVAAHCYFYTIGRDNLSIFFWFYIPLFMLIILMQLTGIYLTISSRYRRDRFKQEPGP